MSFLPAPLEPIRPGLLGSVAPVTRLCAGLLIVASAAVTIEPAVVGRLILVDLLALTLLSGLPIGRALRRLSVVLVPALGLGVIATILYAEPTGAGHSAEVLVGWPIRITAPALAAGVALFGRLVVFAITSVLIFATSSSTSIADSLVQQWRLPDRFAYGTLSALRVAPLLAADWAAVSAARRLRGIESGTPWAWLAGLAGRVLVLLVSAIRRSTRMALAMDARGFDAGRPRSRYRPIRIELLDWLLLLAAGVVAVGVHLI